MQLSMLDVTVYVYNVAVALTMGFLVVAIGIEDRLVLIGMAFALGVFWTLYFRYSMLSKLVDLAPEEDESEPDSEPDRV